jgi:hypothetical protein
MNISQVMPLALLSPRFVHLLEPSAHDTSPLDKKTAMGGPCGAMSRQLSALSLLTARICPPTPLSSVIMANENGFVESLFWPREE